MVRQFYADFLAAQLAGGVQDKRRVMEHLSEELQNWEFEVSDEQRQPRLPEIRGGKGEAKMPRRWQRLRDDIVEPSRTNSKGAGRRLALL